jgi:uncharacterized membrane protein YidH (DUF202 family)
MYFVTFIAALIIILVAAGIFIYGLAQYIQNKNAQARNNISRGYFIALIGIIAAAIIFGVFSV